GYRAVRVVDACAVYRRRPGTLSLNHDLMLASLRKVYRRMAEELDVDPAARAAAARALAALEVDADVLAGRRPAAAALRRARNAVSAAKSKLLGRRLWYETPPPEVAAAFPDLRAV